MAKGFNKPSRALILAFLLQCLSSHASAQKAMGPARSLEDTSKNEKSKFPTTLNEHQTQADAVPERTQDTPSDISWVVLGNPLSLVIAPMLMGTVVFEPEIKIFLHRYIGIDILPGIAYEFDNQRSLPGDIITQLASSTAYYLYDWETQEKWAVGIGLGGCLVLETIGTMDIYLKLRNHIIHGRGKEEETAKRISIIVPAVGFHVIDRGNIAIDIGFGFDFHLVVDGDDIYRRRDMGPVFYNLSLKLGFYGC